VKWAALLVVLAGSVLLSKWLRRDPNSIIKALMLMGFLPFALDLEKPFHLYMAIISWPDWPGFVKGAEFSLLDGIALAVYLSLPRSRQMLPFRISMALYFGAVLLSAFQAQVPMAVLFYCWQLARMLLVYAAVARAGVDPRAAPALLFGMTAGLLLQGGIAAWDRFALGFVQSGGTVHQNLLGMMSHFVIFPMFALLLAGRGNRVLVVGTLIGLTVEVLTTSRATIGLAAFAYTAVFALSALRRWTTRKAQILMAGILVLAIIAPLVAMSFDRRFAAEAVFAPSNYDERAAFQRAATTMLYDHPLGVGANHYVVVANVEGYNKAAGVIPALGSLSANVHNVYLLVAAETGYLGLIALAAFLIWPMVVAFLAGWRHRKDHRGDLLLGLGVTLLTVYLHNFYEWIFVTFQVQYLLAMDLGMLVGLAHQLGYWGQNSSSRSFTLRSARMRLRPMGVRRKQAEAQHDS
jgi:O-antigen ligase